MRANPETLLQIALAEYLHRVMPDDIPWSHFPAGGGTILDQEGAGQSP